MKYTLIFGFIIWSSLLIAQELKTDSSRQEVNIIGAYLDEEKIILRWVPSSPSVWSYSKFYGYRLERCELDTTTGKQSEWSVLGSESMKPISLDKWRTLVTQHPDDHYLQAAGQAHYGERGQAPVTMKDMVAKSNEFNNYYAVAMLSAEFSALAAETSAMRYEDRDIEAGKLYLYRIRTLCPSATMDIKEGITSVATSAVQEFPKISTDHVYEGENVIELTWDRNVYRTFYTAFNVYRSSDEGNTWEKLNAIPFAYTGVKNENLYYYRDSIAQNYMPLLYRLEGLTPFATTGPSSDPVLAMGRDRTPPTAPFNIQTDYLGNNRMKITWDADPADRDIAGFRVSKSNVANEGFMELTISPLAADQRMYIDTACDEMLNNYYYVGVFDLEGNVNVGFPTYGTIIDSVPPSPPTGLAGVIDTNGVVTLSWDLGQEPDLKGYYIHSSNRPDQTYINRTGHAVQDTVWRDTIPLNVLTEKIYYRLVAVDMRSNYSAYSRPLELKKPDKVPPVAPVFIQVRNEKDEVQLEWYNSTSLDVMENVVERKAKEEKEYTVIHRCNSSQSIGRLSDRAIKDGITYQYRIYARDDDQLRSDISGEMIVTAFIDKTLDAVQDLDARVIPDKNQVQLSWKYPAASGIRFAIYRSLNGSPYQSYQVINEKLQFTDIAYKGGDVVRFKIKVINAKGWHSAFSREAEVVFDAQ